MKTIETWYIDKLKTVSEANCSENHWVKSRRHKLQKAKVKVAMRTQRPPPFTDLPERLNDKNYRTLCPITVIVTRIAPRQLDCQDNLPCSLKWIVDSIAEELTGDYRPGRADDATWITWEYRQEKGKPKQYAIKIEIVVEDD